MSDNPTYQRDAAWENPGKPIDQSWKPLYRQPIMALAASAVCATLSKRLIQEGVPDDAPIYTLCDRIEEILKPIYGSKEDITVADIISIQDQLKDARLSDYYGKVNEGIDYLIRAFDHYRVGTGQIPPALEDAKVDIAKAIEPAAVPMEQAYHDYGIAWGGASLILFLFAIEAVRRLIKKRPKQASL